MGLFGIFGLSQPHSLPPELRKLQLLNTLTTLSLLKISDTNTTVTANRHKKGLFYAQSQSMCSIYGRS